MYSSKLQTTELTIKPYQQAIIYEPTNDRADMRIYEYLDHAPRQIFSYTKDFMAGTSKECDIMDEPPVFLCKGFDTVKEHEYLDLKKEFASYVQLYCVDTAVLPNHAKEESIHAVRHVSKFEACGN